MQLVHCVVPLAGAYEPAAHSPHAVDAEPVANDPMRHALHAVAPGTGLADPGAHE